MKQLVHLFWKLSGAFLLLALISTSAWGQTKRQYEKAGDKAFENANYKEAYNRYNVVVTVDSNDFVGWYKFAEAARLYKSYLKAESGYSTVNLHPNAGSDTFALTPFWLATVYKYRGKYPQAAKLFQEFLNSDPKVDPYYLERANKEKDGAEWARAFTDRVLASTDPGDPELFKVDSVRLVDQNNIINDTFYTDFGAVWEDDFLYYSSLRFRTDKDKLKPPRFLSKILKSRNGLNVDTLNLLEKDTFLHLANLNFAPGKNRAYYNVCAYEGESLRIRCGIYFSNIEADGSWGAPESVGVAINSDSTDNRNPSIGFDNDTGQEILYFSSDRPGSKTRPLEGAEKTKDIWYVPLNEDGTAAGNPVNLELTNTIENEQTPFFHSRFQTLYFSSDGHHENSLGGFDVYQIRKVRGEWQPVEHMGWNVNSSFDDTHFSVDSLGKVVFFSSNRKKVVESIGDSSNCCLDIYTGKLEPPLIKANMIALCGFDTIPDVTYTLQNLDQPDEEALVFESTDGSFQQDLLREQTYQLTLTKKDYTTETQTISTKGLANTGDTTFNFILRPLYSDLSLEVLEEIIEQPIEGVSTQLLAAPDSVVRQEVLPAGNTFAYTRLRNGQIYTIKVSHPNYITKALRIRMPENICNPIVLDTIVRMKRIVLDTFPVYFDNDRPGPRNVAFTEANEDYLSTYNKYRRQLFRNQYNNATAFRHCQDKFTAEDLARLDSFFVNDLDGGMKNLEEFVRLLKEDYIPALSNNQALEIKFRGFASPAARGPYNKSLTDRRLDSIIKYMNNAFGDQVGRKIRLDERPQSFGESMAPENVPDENQDRCRSVYSVEASKERRVEILGVLVIDTGPQIDVPDID